MKSFPCNTEKRGTENITVPSNCSSEEEEEEEEEEEWGDLTITVITIFQVELTEQFCFVLCLKMT
jgi:hypothetical protein